MIPIICDLGGCLGFLNIAIGCIIFEEAFWPWYYMIHEEEAQRIAPAPLPEDPTLCPICADEDGDCILLTRFDEKTIRSISAHTLSFKAGETTSLRDLSRKPRDRSRSRDRSRDNLIGNRPDRVRRERIRPEKMDPLSRRKRNAERRARRKTTEI